MSLPNHVEDALENFEEISEIEYKVTATVNGEEVGVFVDHEFMPAFITGASYEDLGEQWRKIENSVNDEIENQFKDKAEPDYDHIDEGVYHE